MPEEAQCEQTTLLVRTDEVYYSDASASGASRIPEHYFRLFKRLEISPGADVLDVACGTGEWLDACAGKNCSVSGVDLSAKATAICRERLPQGVVLRSAS